MGDKVKMNYLKLINALSVKEVIDSIEITIPSDDIIFLPRTKFVRAENEQEYIDLCFYNDVILHIGKKEIVSIEVYNESAVITTDCQKYQFNY